LGDGIIEDEVPDPFDWLGVEVVFGAFRWVHAFKQSLGIPRCKRFYGLSDRDNFAVNGFMAKKNGKWVVGIICLAVAILAFISTRLKKDMMNRSPESVEQATESQ
tara:strand:- start:1149 stop:1463 length:315 start_codon:yes stop_codon:yes gene_type:complete